jgi:hypothetical protein
MGINGILWGEFGILRNSVEMLDLLAARKIPFSF